MLDWTPTADSIPLTFRFNEKRMKFSTIRRALCRRARKFHLADACEKGYGRSAKQYRDLHRGSAFHNETAQLSDAVDKLNGKIDVPAVSLALIRGYHSCFLLYLAFFESPSCNERKLPMTGDERRVVT